MKSAVAIIKPHQLDALRDALLGVGVSGLTVTEVKRFGSGEGHEYSYRGAVATVAAVPKLQVEVALGDAPLARVLDIIADGLGGRVGEQIFVQPLHDVVRIRTGDAHEKALE